MSGEESFVTFGAVGDIAFRLGVVEGVRQNNIDWPFALVKDSFQEMDLLFGNWESVFHSPDSNYEELDPQGLIIPLEAQDVVESLKRSNFNFLNLAANHILDAGDKGMFYTQALIESSGIATAGIGVNQIDASKPVVLRKKNITFGFLCYCEDSNYSLGKEGSSYAYYDPAKVLSDIAGLKSQVDIVVVSVHADLEFMPVPSVPRVQAFREFARAGAHIVLGHHPHVPQGVELLEGSLIVYSLGNFLFPAHSSPYNAARLPDTSYSYILKCKVSKNGVDSYQRIPVVINAPPDERPQIATGDTAVLINNHLQQLDDYLQDELYLQTVWDDICKKKLEGVLTSVMRYHLPELPKWKRAICRLLNIPTSSRLLAIDMEYLLEDVVGRLCLTAENRNWMLNILSIAEKNWERRNSEFSSQNHRPHYYMQRKYRHKKSR